jgi:hypothetical protein
VSSTYRVICFGHTTPLILDDTESSDVGTALAKAETPRAKRHHPDCDLLIGRWSGALIALGCPPMPAPFARQLAMPCRSSHSSVEWIDDEWLRLAVAVDSISPSIDTAATNEARAILDNEVRRCWSSPARLAALRKFFEAEDAGQ